MSNLERYKAAEWALHMIDVWKEADEAVQIEEVMEEFDDVREEAWATLSADERAEVMLFAVFLDGED